MSEQFGESIEREKMTRRKNKTKKRDPDKLEITANKGEETKGEAIARVSVHPVARATVASSKWPVIGGADITDLMKALNKQCKEVKEGDMSNMETMLAAQAYTLDAMFNRLLMRAEATEYMNHLESYLKLAFKAQAQARSTIEAISAVKNPPVARYVGQANIAHGHQQVNNGDSRAGENQNVKNELLEEKNNGEWMDTGTKEEAGGDDPAMETMGAVNRAKNRRR